MESFLFLLGCYAGEPITGAAAWQMAAAAVTGFIAKENVVGTLAVCFVGLENLIDTEVLALMEGAGAACCAGDCRVIVSLHRRLCLLRRKLSVSSGLTGNENLIVLRCIDCCGVVR